MKYKLTKLIASIGPATEKIENLEALIEAGANVARLNFSHGNAIDHLEKFEYIKSVRARYGENISILLDTKGPEIRTHKFKEGEATILLGTEVKIYLKKEILGDSTQFSISYPDLDKDIKVGGTVLIDDGYLELKVTAICEEYITTKAINTHIVADRRGVNIPGGIISIDFLSDKDQSDIKFAAAAKFDYIALSFVQSANDVKKVRKLLAESGVEDIQLISKLESHGAVENFDEILQESDGIMVARGDLGVEIDAEMVPTLQKKWIKEANKMSKPVIVATQMLESMTYNPRPTRAEVSDVYNAIEDGTDAIMLSGESAKGQYWLESTKYMTRICLASEYNFDGARFYNRMLRDGSFSKYAEQAQEAFKHTFISHINHVFVLNSNREQVKITARMKPKAKVIPVYDNLKDVTSWGIVYGVFPKFYKQELSIEDEKLLREFFAAYEELKKGEQVLVIDGKKMKTFTI